jgi:hypothetical protein
MRAAREAKEGSPEMPSPESIVGARARVRESARQEEVSPAEGSASGPRLRPAPEPPGTGSRAGRDAAARAVAVVNTAAATSLLSRQPSSMAQARNRHHVAAGHFEAGLIRWPRLAWGYFHLLVKAVLHVAEWVTESPPRLAVTIVLIVVLHFWA